jgi:protein disulfide-isomerase A6
MGIKGFPTLKIFRPSKKSGRPSIEEYQGARTAKAIVDAVVQKIPNHVKRVTDTSMSGWLAQANETAKVVLFTDKGTTSALLRALAIDFLGSVNFGQVRNTEKNSVEAFGVDKFPTLLLLPGGDKDPLVYDGEMKKDLMSEFVSQAAAPNPDPAPEPASKPKPKPKSKKAKRADQDPKSDDGSSDQSSDTPKADEPLSLIPPIMKDSVLREKCFSSTSKLCALVLLPQFSPKTDGIPEGMVEALRSMAEVYDKHTRRRVSFPVFLVEPSLPMVATLRAELGLKPGSELEIIAVNAKRMWWRKYSGPGYNINTVEAWIDSIRMNEGQKETLPEGLVSQAPPVEADDTEADSNKEEQEKEKEEHDEL